ncbi:hypothetical protein R3W88_015834 [Solanum pinnatisectum]|uniref:Uncharacterized protein n=1 Tax=Solanum pinnatisectum TaxID=50273 RepID=A0AAV9KW02_9SOLN|nr:hypothetical protein R3W88_015834 [Solanum pinnatisectum]
MYIVFFFFFYPARTRPNPAVHQRNPATHTKCVQKSARSLNPSNGATVYLRRPPRRYHLISIRASPFSPFRGSHSFFPSFTNGFGKEERIDSKIQRILPQIDPNFLL